MIRRPGHRRESTSSDSSDESALEKERKEKSILHRTSSTLTKGSIGGKSAKSVKFVEIPAVCYEYAYEDNDSCDFEQGKGVTEGKQRQSFWNRIRVAPMGKRMPKTRPVISGPYRLNSSSPSLLLVGREKRKDDMDRESVKSMGRHGSREQRQAIFKGWLGLGIGRIVDKLS
jgi:hypothetical protein